MVKELGEKRESEKQEEERNKKDREGEKIYEKRTEVGEREEMKESRKIGRKKE